MKITEILVEDRALNEAGIGKGIEKVAGGIGKAAGYIAGIPGGLKKAFQKGKARATAGIGGEMPDEPDQNDPEFDKEYSRLTGKPSGAAQPAAGNATGGDAAAAPPQQGGGFVQGFKQGMGIGGKQSPAATTTAQVNKQGPSGTAPAKVSGAAQQQALTKTAQAAGGDPTKAAQTLYATVKSQVNQLDKKGKQRILQLLQKSLQQTPAAAPATGPGSKTAGTTAAGQPKVEPDLNAPAEQPATAAGKKKSAPRKKAAPSQAEIDADREARMGPTSDSVIRKGNMVAEGFTLFKR